MGSKNGTPPINEPTLIEVKTEEDAREIGKLAGAGYMPTDQQVTSIRDLGEVGRNAYDAGKESVGSGGEKTIA